MKSYSQAGQDTFVYDLFGDTGFFVDIGAEDGITHSNTYALGLMGWDGICVEPDPASFQELHRNRSCLRFNTAISDHNGAVTVYPSGQVAPCVTLASLLESADAPPILDYLSIDVEGHELAVLAGMDWKRWDVRCITIETNVYLHGTAQKDAIFEVLTGHGFERIVEDVVAPGYGIFEDIYVNGN